MAPLGLGSGEGHLVLYLGRYAPVTIAELHRVFGLKRSTLTSILDRLEKRNVIRREVCREDRRSFLVYLTPEGRRLARQVERPVAELEAGITRGVSPEDLAGFRRVMESIARATEVELRNTKGQPNIDQPKEVS
ncbi:MAG: MarR family transcriptional regulator [Gemmatimonadetes bacterium]|nr:MarR family transcriptional regulator [Gemmatimonadota bacterium]